MLISNRGKLIRIGGLLLLLLFLVGALLLFFNHRSSQALIKENFIEKRTSLATGGMNQLRQTVENEYGYLFYDCKDRNEYDRLIDADSRLLTVAELTRALELHNECGDFFMNKSNLAINLLEKDVEYLKEYVPLFSSGEKAKNAEVASKYWNDIYELEKERAVIFSRLVSIQ